MPSSNIVFAVYRMDENDLGVQEFRVISLTDEAGLIDLSKLKEWDLSSLRQNFSQFKLLETAIVRLAKILDCEFYVCLSLPEYNRLVSECTDLDMLQESMRKFARPLVEIPLGGASIVPPSPVLEMESDQKKGWIGRIFS
ncbi:MAG: hypothetical protein QE271_09115 [Bacteriovoracaceae bacterium]|nr:hypothetical protein [Bacteriovoracaceae bacterium]